MLESTATIRCKEHQITIKAVDGLIYVSAPSKRLKRWAIRMLKCEAEKWHITLNKINDMKYYVSIGNTLKAHNHLIPNLKAYNNPDLCRKMHR